MTTQPVNLDDMRNKKLSTVDENSVARFMQKNRKQLESLLANAPIDADRVMRLALTLIPKTYGIGNCKVQSLFGALIECAKMGLEPNGALGHAYLVPFKGDLQVIVGYQGKIDLIMRDDRIRSIIPKTVYENDVFDMAEGSQRYLKHVPCPPSRRGEVMGYYIVVQYSDGNVNWFWMWREEVEEVRDKFSAGAYDKDTRNPNLKHPWWAHPESMAHKTVLHRFAKWLPKSVEIRDRLVKMEAMEANEGQVVMDRLGDIFEGEVIVTGNSSEPADNIDIPPAERADPPADTSESSYTDKNTGELFDGIEAVRWIAKINEANPHPDDKKVAAKILRTLVDAKEKKEAADLINAMEDDVGKKPTLPENLLDFAAKYEEYKDEGRRAMGKRLNGDKELTGDQRRLLIDYFYGK